MSHSSLAVSICGARVACHPMSYTWLSQLAEIVWREVTVGIQGMILSAEGQFVVLHQGRVARQ